jgi:hypothetical protein
MMILRSQDSVTPVPVERIVATLSDISPRRAAMIIAMGFRNTSVFNSAGRVFVSINPARFLAAVCHHFGIPSNNSQNRDCRIFC